IHLESGMTTSDEFYPRAAIVPGGGLLITAARWDRAPHLALAERGTLRQVLSLSNPGTDWLESQLGRLEEVTWTAPDGLQISGFLAPTRGGSGPQPTVLVVHGGPAWCYRDSWPGLDGANHALLSCCGFQLFFPNPRGSSGRGQDFLARELGDYGGGEVDDLLSGLDHLVKSGAADPDRLGVVGVSHGGYMSCWLTTRTRRFRAAVAVSPVTDWYSQHFGSNIPEFDEMYLRGDPHQPGGPYFERSPVFFAHLSKTPTLLTAGLQDRCTPPGQAEEFHQALLAAGTQSDLVVYPEEGHGVRQLRAKVDLGARMSGHLARHLLKGSPA
ncbi:MAG: alpha/beta hydrolase family protein, partial [Candidatus Dormibacteria bacterium]